MAWHREYRRHAIAATRGHHPMSRRLGEKLDGYYRLYCFKCGSATRTPYRQCVKCGSTNVEVGVQENPTTGMARVGKYTEGSVGIPNDGKWH